jgi:hypothetical protein
MLLLGINLGHWQSFLVYLLILQSSFLQRISVSAKCRRIVSDFHTHARKMNLFGAPCLLT